MSRPVPSVIFRALQCAMLMAGGVLMAEESVLPAQAQLILVQLDKDTLAARTKAVGALRSLQSACTRKGDLSGALAVKRVMADLETGQSAPTAMPRSSEASSVTAATLVNRAKTLVGVYITPGGSAITLHLLTSVRTGGTYSCAFLGWSPEGSWSVIDETTVRFMRPDGSEWLFDVDGLNLYNRTDKVKWTRQQ